MATNFLNLGASVASKVNTLQGLGLLGKQAGGLWQNKLFQQLLVGLGTDLLQNTPGKNVVAAFGQNLGAQGYLGILQKMLGGDFSAGGDVKLSSDGMKINIPAPVNGAGGGGTSAGAGAGAATSGATGGGTSITTPQGNIDLRRIMSALGPTVNLSGISAADLAGVDPQLITQALQFKFGQEELGTRRFSELVDASYKQGLLSDYAAKNILTAQGQAIDLANAETSRINALRQVFENLRQAPINVPGLDKEMSLDTFKALPDKVKAYSYYAYNEKLAGNEPLSYNDWDNQTDASGTVALIREAMADEDFKKLLFEYKRTGPPGTTVNIGNKVEEDLARGYIQSRIQLYNPQDREKAINAEFKKLGISDQIIAKMQGNTPEAKKIRIENVKKAMRNIITAGRGVIDDVQPTKDGKSLVWLVTWTNMDGTKTQEVITHAVE